MINVGMLFLNQNGIKMIKINIDSSSVAQAMKTLKETINSADQEKLKDIRFGANDPPIKVFNDL